MTFRYLIVDTSGDVTGTNDSEELPEIDSDDISCIIDTKDNTFANEDKFDEAIQQYESECDDSDSDDEL